MRFSRAKRGISGAWLVVFAAGCFPSRSNDYACKADSDCTSGRVCDRGYCVVGSTDAAPEVDAPPMIDCSMFTARHFAGCSIPPPTGALALMTAGTYTYDTDAGTLVDPGGAPVAAATQMIDAGRLISVDRLTVGAGATLRVVGAQPLVVASWSTITIDGAVDASSSVAGGNGAGANPAGCAAHVPAAGGSNSTGAGGGGGGGYQGGGGKGGTGDAGGGGNGGTTFGTPPLLAGGCAGARGGDGDNNNSGGAGGSGGGAIQLTAFGAIDVRGTIHAGGAGGRGAVSSDAAGGGGGSGGMIGLDGSTVTIHAGAIVAANGGAGGGGSENNPGGNGGDGAASAAKATGGTVNGDAGTGGPGSCASAPAGTQGNNNSNHGAGGGGGGVGYVVVHGTQAFEGGAVLSPAITGV